ncbi:hypothetical protein ABIC65_001093 [Sphingomonas trueperi]|uniref:hypothetical protein n=1 Tax=Sphingomonas trueperi TaxID=53317 RepID=UPI003396E422
MRDDIDAELLRELVYALIRRGVIDDATLDELRAGFERKARHFQGSTRRHRYELLAHRAALLPIEAAAEDEAQHAASQRRARIRAVPDGGN